MGLTKVTSIRFGEEYRTDNEHHFAFVGFQHEVVVIKPEIDIGDVFRNLSETGVKSKLRGALYHS